jgi:hypothetical protein
MVSFYEKIGFTHTGLRHTEPLWQEDRVLNIMIINTFELIVGRGVNPFYWNVMWRDVAQYLSAQSVIEPTGIDKMRLIAYRALGPLSTIAMQFRKLSRPSGKAERKR